MPFVRDQLWIYSTRHKCYDVCVFVRRCPTPPTPRVPRSFCCCRHLAGRLLPQQSWLTKYKNILLIFIDDDCDDVLFYQTYFKDCVIFFIVAISYYYYYFVAGSITLPSHCHCVGDNNFFPSLPPSPWKLHNMKSWLQAVSSKDLCQPFGQPRRGVPRCFFHILGDHFSYMHAWIKHHPDPSWNHGRHFALQKHIEVEGFLEIVCSWMWLMHTDQLRENMLKRPLHDSADSCPGDISSQSHLLSSTVRRGDLTGPWCQQERGTVDLLIKFPKRHMWKRHGVPQY